MSWLFLALAIAVEMVAAMSMRASEGLRKKVWLAPMAVGYLLAFTMLALSMTYGMPVGVAYGVWSAVGIALTAVLARIIFDDPLTLLMGIGMVVIMGGVLLVEAGMRV